MPIKTRIGLRMAEMDDLRVPLECGDIAPGNGHGGGTRRRERKERREIREEGGDRCRSWSLLRYRIYPPITVGIGCGCSCVAASTTPRGISVAVHEVTAASRIRDHQRSAFFERYIPEITMGADCAPRRLGFTITIVGQRHRHNLDRRRHRSGCLCAGSGGGAPSARGPGGGGRPRRDDDDDATARLRESIGASRSRALGGGEGQSIGSVRKTLRVRATGASWGLLCPP